MVVIVVSGPPPKRSSQRRRRNKDAVPVETVFTPSTEITRPTPDVEWHPIARGWYDSLAPSAVSRWYEPSDWAVAVFVAESMSRALYQNKPISGHTFAAIMSGTASLMSTEADRRRLKIEIARAGDGDADEDASVTALADYTKRFGA